MSDQPLPYETTDPSVTAPAPPDSAGWNRWVFGRNRRMTLVRILILTLATAILFRVVLLPIRGAVAASMLCEMGPGHHDSVTEAKSFATAPAHLEHGDGHIGHTHALPSEGDSAGGAGSSSGSDSCNLCATCCSVTAVLLSSPADPAPRASASVSYPSFFSAAAPSFISGGLERPPRSI